MALIVDPYKILQTIGRNQTAFAAIKADASKAGQKLFEKQIKHKSTDLETLCAIYEAFGDEDFKIMIDGLDKLGPAIKRLDTYNPALKAMTARDCRAHLLSLASRKIAVTEKPAKKESKSKKTKAKKVESDFMKSESLKVRDRERE